MNFRPQRRDEPELNLIPMIDVLIVLLIFMVLTTTFQQQASLEISLPDSSSASPRTAGGDTAIVLHISRSGEVSVLDQPLGRNAMDRLRSAIKLAAGDQADPLIVIDADREATHQAVIEVMDVISQLGFTRVEFGALKRRDE